MAIEGLTQFKSANVDDETGHKQSLMDLGEGQKDGVSVPDFIIIY